MKSALPTMDSIVNNAYDKSTPWSKGKTVDKEFLATLSDEIFCDGLMLKDP
jgi:hypothetical protein